MIHYLRQIWDRFRDFIVTGFLLLFSLFIITKSESPSVNSFKTFVFGTFSFATSFVSNVILMTDLRSENEDLRRKNAELMLEVNSLREYGIENESYKQMLQLKDTSTLSLVTSKIIAKSFSPAQGTITLDKGSNDGIMVGMPVINGNGLIGIVHSVSSAFSIVRTLRNVHLKLIIRNERSRSEGILKWTGEYLTVTNLPKTADVKHGDRIVTSDISSVINKPLFVGRVAKIINPESGYFNDLIISPGVDFNSIKSVFVVKTTQFPLNTLPQTNERGEQ